MLCDANHFYDELKDTQLNRQNYYNAKKHSWDSRKNWKSKASILALTLSFYSDSDMCLFHRFDEKGISIGNLKSFAIVFESWVHWYTHFFSQVNKFEWGECNLKFLVLKFSLWSE